MELTTLKTEAKKFINRKNSINETTGKAYNSSLNYFIYYLENIALASEINEKNINTYLEEFKGALNNGLTITKEDKTKTITFKAGTINTHLKRNETFLRSLNFNVSVNKFRTNNKKFKALSVQQLLYFYTECYNAFKNPELALRTNVLIKFLFNTAFRINEALNIKLSEVYERDNKYYVLIHEKGKAKTEKTEIEISEELYNLLMDYVNKRALDSDYLFSSLKANKKGLANKLLSKEVSKNIKKLAVYVDNKYNTNTLELVNNNSTHIFRHSRAYFLLNTQKYDIIKVKEILRHSNINTTMLYLNEKEEKINNIRVNNDIL